MSEYKTDDDKLTYFNLRKSIRRVLRFNLIKIMDNTKPELNLFVKNVSAYLNQLDGLHKDGYTMKDERQELTYTSFIMDEWNLLDEKYRTNSLWNVIREIVYYRV